MSLCFASIKFHFMCLRLGLLDDASKGIMVVVEDTYGIVVNIIQLPFFTRIIKTYLDDVTLIKMCQTVKSYINSSPY